MVTVKVDPGACRFDAVITVKKVLGGEVDIKKGSGADIMKALGGEVEISIATQCPNITRLKEAISKVKISEAMTLPSKNLILRKANETLPHSACPLPCAIVKAVEAEIGFATKKDITISFEKVENKNP